MGLGLRARGLRGEPPLLPTRRDATRSYRPDQPVAAPDVDLPVRHFEHLGDLRWGALRERGRKRLRAGLSGVLPLYPLLVRLSTALFGGSISGGALSAYGVLVSLVAFFFALYFVYRIAEEGWSAGAA